MPNRYYIVKNVVVDNISRDFDKYNTISVTFTLEPFKYDIYDKTMILTKSEKIYYMGNAKGKPKLKIYGSGNIELTINSETIQIKNIDEYVELDSKFLLCLNKNQQSKSRDMSGGFPILTKGINNISWTGNVTKIELLKRTAYLQVINMSNKVSTKICIYDKNTLKRDVLFGNGDYILDNICKLCCL